MFCFMGAWMKWDNFAVGNFIRDACNGNPIRVLGGGKAVRTYLYGSDMAIWLWNILINGRNGNVYDIGGTMQVTIEQAAREVARNFDRPAKIEIMNNMQSEPMPMYIPKHLAKPRVEFGLGETVSFEEAVSKTVWSYLHEGR
jgi:nucleoside-diphosphate-sugar epimerase